MFDSLRKIAEQILHVFFFFIVLLIIPRIFLTPRVQKLHSWQASTVCCMCLLTQLCLLTVACQAPLFMKFSRHEHWIAIPFFRGSSQPRDQTWVSCIAGRFFTIWASRASVDIHRCKEHITHMPLLKKIFKKILFPDSNNSEWTFQSRDKKEKN